MKEGKNILVIERSLCKAPEAGKSMESLRKVRVAAVQKARGTGPHEAGETVTTVSNWDVCPRTLSRVCMCVYA